MRQLRKARDPQGDDKEINTIYQHTIFLSIIYPLSFFLERILTVIETSISSFISRQLLLIPQSTGHYCILYSVVRYRGTSKTFVW